MLRRRLRTLDEAEAYRRCYGLRDPNVAVIPSESPWRAEGGRMSGESLRAAFERRLDARDPDLPHEAEAA